MDEMFNCNKNPGITFPLLLHSVCFTVASFKLKSFKSVKAGINFLYGNILRTYILYITSYVFFLLKRVSVVLYGPVKPHITYHWPFQGSDAIVVRVLSVC